MILFGLLAIIILWFLSRKKENFQNTLYPYRQITFHYVPWSPTCAEVNSVWEQMKSNIKTIKFTEVNEDIAKTEYIYTYPTIILIDENGKRHQYRGQFTYEKLSDWALSDYHIF